MTIQENQSLINTFFYNKIADRMNSNSLDAVYHEKLKDFDFKLQTSLITPNNEHEDKNNTLALKNRIKQDNEYINNVNLFIDRILWEIKMRFNLHEQNYEVDFKSYPISVYIITENYKLLFVVAKHISYIFRKY